MRLLYKIFIICLSMFFSDRMSGQGDNSIQGNIWVEQDGNTTYNAEYGPTGVQVDILDADQDTLVGSVQTINGKFVFEDIENGKYYLRIPFQEFLLSGNLPGTASCPGNAPANDMVDNDDNGIPQPNGDVVSTSFDLSNSDTTSTQLIDYIDFCFYYDCALINHLAVETCTDASQNIICDLGLLDNFCSTLPSQTSGGSQPIPLCMDGSAENIVWLAFVAPGGTYDIVVNPHNCMTNGLGEAGIEVGIYDDCDFSNVIYCTACTKDPVTISSDSLVEGGTYYLYINGCSGSICEYSIDILGTPIYPQVNPTDVCVYNNGILVCDSTSFCLGIDATFEATGVAVNSQYAWEISTVAGYPFSGDSLPVTNTQTLNVTFDSVGVYKVCLTGVTGICGGTEWMGSECIDVTITGDISGPMDEVFPVQTICPNTIVDFGFNVLDTIDPNGDGVSGWLGDEAAVVGLNATVISVPGCAYTQEVVINEYPESGPGQVSLVICDDQLPYDFMGLTINESDFTATMAQISGYVLPGESDVYGCDSTIDISIERLILSDGNIQIGPCGFTGLVIEYVYDQSQSSPLVLMNFVWKDPQGNMLTDDYQPNNPTNIAIDPGSPSGTYTLEVSISKGGTSCLYTYPFVVDFADYIPGTPQITGPQSICYDIGVVTYTASGVDDAFQYSWTYPQDVGFANVSGFMGQILQIDWFGSNGGTISVTAQNQCGVGPAASITVDVLDEIPVDFVLDDIACIDVATTIEYNGGGTGIGTYIWNFDGGVIQNGTNGIGPGPHEVLWTNGGNKNVSLQVVGNNGCQSSLLTKMISVVDNPAPPVVTCTSSQGVVVFSWTEDPVIYSGYNVNVLDGPQGILGQGTYTISGLDDGQTVSIMLVADLIDQTCGTTVSVTAECEAQNCVPPQIVLTASETLVCLEEDSPNVILDANITPPTNGQGVFIGQGIIDPIAGIFNPTIAGEGLSSIVYVFTADGQDSCMATASINIEVVNPPQASIDLSADMVCVGDQVLLFYNGSALPEEYLWMSNNDTLGMQDTIVISFDEVGTYQVTLVVTKDGCPSKPVSVIINVSDEVVLSFDVVSSACVGEEVHLTYTGTPGINLIWDFDGGAGIGTENPIVIFNTPGTKTITLSSDFMGCGGDDFSLNIDVVNQPEAEFTISDNTPCVGEVVDFEYTGSSEVTAYEWKVNGLLAGTDSTLSIAFSDVGQTTISLVVENGNCISEENINTIEVLESPEASFSIDGNSYCVFDTVFVSYTGTPDPQSIEWNVDGVLVDLSNGYLIFDEPGTKTLGVVVTNDGCSSETSQIIFIEAPLGPVQLSCAAGTDSLVFFWNSISGASGYNIMIGNIDFGEVVDTFYLLDGLGPNVEVTVTVTPTGSTVCPEIPADISCKTNMETATEDKSLKYSIHPNPALDVLYLKGMEGVTDFKICDISGRIVEHGSTETGVIDIHSLSPGMYILLMKDQKGKRYTYRVAKE